MDKKAKKYKKRFLSPASPSSRLRIGIDLDGVVIDHTANFLRAAKMFGYTLKPWQINSNILKNFLPQGVKKAVQRRVYSKLRSSAAVMQGCLPILRHLAKRYRLIAVSVQKQREGERKLWPWLRKHGILKIIPKARIHILRTRKTKLLRIKKLRPDVFIDDGLDVLEKLPRGIMPVLFDPEGVAVRLRKRKDIRVARGWSSVPQQLVI